MPAGAAAATCRWPRPRSAASRRPAPAQPRANEAAQDEGDREQGRSAGRGAQHLDVLPLARRPAVDERSGRDQRECDGIERLRQAAVQLDLELVAPDGIRIARHAGRQLGQVEFLGLPPALQVAAAHHRGQPDRGMVEVQHRNTAGFLVRFLIGAVLQDRARPLGAAGDGAAGRGVEQAALPVAGIVDDDARKHAVAVAALGIEGHARRHLGEDARLHDDAGDVAGDGRLHVVVLAHRPGHEVEAEEIADERGRDGEDDRGLGEAVVADPDAAHDHELAVGAEPVKDEHHRDEDGDGQQKRQQARQQQRDELERHAHRQASVDDDIEQAQRLAEPDGEGQARRRHQGGQPQLADDVDTEVAHGRP